MAEPAPRVVVFTNERTGGAFTMTVPPTSPWWTMLAPVTEAAIRVPTVQEQAEDAAYRDAGGLWLPKRDAKAAR